MWRVRVSSGECLSTRPVEGNLNRHINLEEDFKKQKSLNKTNHVYEKIGRLRDANRAGYRPKV